MRTVIANITVSASLVHDVSRGYCIGFECEVRGGVDFAVTRALPT